MHSCLGSFDDAYGGAIGQFWREVAAKLSPDSHVLDVGTGNGALPKLLWDRVGEGAAIHIDAVDLADVAPMWHDTLRYPFIRFHPGVAMERLPFDDGVFDLVVSQFGIEYAQRPAVLHEVLRVTGSAGVCAFVMHHESSVLARVAREEAGHQGRLLAASGPLEAAAAVLPWIAQARSGNIPAGDARAEAARARYNESMNVLKARVAESPVPDLLIQLMQWLHRMIATLQPVALPTALKALDEARMGLRDAQLRTGELLDHALSQRDVNEIAEVFRSVRGGADISVEEITQEGGVLGWALRVTG